MIQSHTFTTTGPIRLIQGMMGMTAQMPIYVTGVNQSELFGRENAGLTRDDSICPFCYNETTRTLFWVSGRYRPDSAGLA